MKKRFRSKKTTKNILKLVSVIIVFGLLSFIILKYFPKINLGLENEQIIEYILEDSNSFFRSKDKNNRQFDFLLKKFYKVDFKNPITLLENTSHYIETNNETILVYNEKYEESMVPVNNEKDAPLVYIYNTHPTETFKNDDLSIHNIEPTIRSMSDVLAEELESLGVKTIVEEGDMTAYLKEHNYNYNYSYLASRYYMEKAYEKYPDIKLFIDLHRDGVDYQYSVTTIDNKKYAKVMFVVGFAHDNYQSSLDASNKINDYLKKSYPSITRGIYRQNAAVFNQDFADNMVLIELGGNNNQLVEVLNTIEILALAIKEYVYEN